MPTPTAPGEITFRQIGQRCRAIWETQQPEIEQRIGNSVESSSERNQAEGDQRRLLKEELALQSLSLTMAPRSLEDAAVLAGCIFTVLERVAACDLDSQLRTGDLGRDLRAVEAAVARLTSVLCRLGGVDPADAGCLDMAGLLILHGAEPFVRPGAVS